MYSEHARVHLSSPAYTRYLSLSLSLSPLSLTPSLFPSTFASYVLSHTMSNKHLVYSTIFHYYRTLHTLSGTIRPD